MEARRFTFPHRQSQLRLDEYPPPRPALRVSAAGPGASPRLCCAPRWRSGFLPPSVLTD